MLQVLVGYVQDLGIPIGWLAITGDARFFAITKRLHNQVHGSLMLVGPAVKDVSDGSEGAAVYGECLLQWRDLGPAARARILLVTPPLHDIDENAAMVNAPQRPATVIAEKSLAEGFGLTVSEEM